MASLAWGSSLGGFVAFVSLRMFRCAAIPEEESLLVRNLFGSRRVPWDEIRRFDIRRSGGIFSVFYVAPVGCLDFVNRTLVRVWTIQSGNGGFSEKTRSLAAEINHEIRSRQGWAPTD